MDRYQVVLVLWYSLQMMIMASCESVIEFLILLNSQKALYPCDEESMIIFVFLIFFSES